MPKYTIVGKAIYWASIARTDMGPDDQGTPRIVAQPGPLTRAEVGSVVEDVPPDVLAAFRDRFALVPEDAAVAVVPEAETPTDPGSTTPQDAPPEEPEDAREVARTSQSGGRQSRRP